MKLYSDLIANLRFLVKYPTRRRIRRESSYSILQQSNLEGVFSTIYQTKYWADDESVSGGGSNSYSLQNLNVSLPPLFSKFGIKTILDAPCGDFSALKKTIIECELEYIGIDIVATLIADLKKEFDDSVNLSFMVGDITTMQLPSADIMICRDALFHLSFSDINLVLRNFLASGIPYLLTTTHRIKGNSGNRDIKSGDFRTLDLFKPPFNFEVSKLAIIEENRLIGNPARQLHLWKRSEIINFLKFHIKPKI